jgi:hypothetical protein
VIITIGSKTFGHSLDSGVSVDMLQRIAENQAKMTLKGYWVPVVVKGEGYIGCLCPNYEILFYPASQVDIDKVNQPRTSSSSGMTQAPRPKLAQGTIGQNFCLNKPLVNPDFVDGLSGFETG